jgi:hypothetical protein
MCWSFWRFFLVANELNRFRATGSVVPVRFAQHLRPVFLRQRRCGFIGSMGIVVFMLSMLLGCVPLAVIYRRILIHAPDRVAQARKQMVLPFGLVLVGFLSFICSG